MTTPFQELTEYGKSARRWRLENDYTMRRMSKEMNISLAYLCEFEQGKRRLSDKHFGNVPAGLRAVWAAIRIDEYTDRISALEILTGEATQ